MYLVIVIVVIIAIVFYHFYVNRKKRVRTNRELAEKFYSEAEGDRESTAIVKSIKYWINAIMDDSDIHALLNLADIYNYYDIVSPELFTPFNYNTIDGLSKSKSVAYSLYSIIANSTYDAELLVTVREKINDLEQFAKRNIFKPPIRKYNNPENFGGKYTHNDTQLLEYAINNANNANVLALGEVEQFGFINANDFTDAVNLAIAIEQEHIEQENTTEQEAVTPIIAPIAIVGGAQNVHDSSVVRSVTNCLKQLSASVDYLIDSPVTVRQIREYIEDKLLDNLQTEFTSVKLNNAIRALDVCERNSVPLSNGYSDTNALQYVWSRINSKCNAERVNCLKDNLVSALADCVENNSVVCATGRVTHC
jgi:hypothetical protein